MYLGFAYIAYVSLVDTPLNRVRAAAATTLGRIGTAESLVHLASAMSEMPGRAASGDKAVRIAACRALSALLPTLPDRGYGLVPLSAVQTASKLLTESDTGVIVDALKLLRLIGGGSAIDSVERCVKASKLPAVKYEAKSTLTILKERRALELQSQRLLRPSEPNEGQPQDLLRSVIGSDEDTTALLRPSDAVESPDHQPEDR
jgi:hypothetical protein